MKAIGIGIIAILAILVLGGAAATVYYIGATSTPAALPNLSASPSAQAAMNTQLYKTLSSQKLVNIVSITQNQSGIPTMLLYNISYLGKVGLTSDVGGVQIPISVPVSVTNLKYLNDSKLALLLVNIPVIGGFNASIVDLAGSVYACTPQSIFAKNATYICYVQQPTNMSTLNLYYFATGLNLTVTNVYPSAFNNDSCIFLNSTFTIPLNSVQGFLNRLSFLNGVTNVTSITSISGILQTCVSTDSNLPDTLDMNLYLYHNNTFTTASLELSQTGSSSIVSDAAIKNLPGSISP
ncbi:MAG: hypothetical protein ACREBF_04830 [Candidatus Micrarchaeales archaeon]